MSPDYTTHHILKTIGKIRTCISFTTQLMESNSKRFYPTYEQNNESLILINLRLFLLLTRQLGFEPRYYFLLEKYILPNEGQKPF